MSNIANRKEIPRLPQNRAAVGKEGDVKRSFDSQNGNPIRLYCGDAFELEIEFQSTVRNARVVCDTNFNQADHSWHELPFRKARKGVYRFAAPATRCGEYAFRIKYSFDDGESWIWDRAHLTHVHVDPIRMKNIRCYTMIPSVLGKINNWIAHLDHVRRMGFNMVHLLPVTQMGQSESPYSATDLFAVDPSFLEPGTDADAGLEAFEAFVEAAREREMSLCVDLVLNHVAPDSKMARSAPDWIVPDKSEPDGLQRSGCWHMAEWLKWGDLVKIYYDHPSPETREAIWQFMTQYALFWANYADRTGGMVRLDNLHNSDEDFITHLLRELRAAYPNLIIHAEFFSDTNTLLKRARDWDLNLFLANPWEYPYAENLRTYLKHCHEIGRRVPQYTPVTTHDTGAPAELFGSAYAVVPRYFITALMSTGQTGAVQGVEYGVPHKVNFIGRNQPFPYSPNSTIVEEITRINAILTQYECLHQVGNLQFVDDDNGAIIGAFRVSANDEQNLGLLLLANLDTTRYNWLEIDLKKITGQSTHLLQDVRYRLDPFDMEEIFRVDLPPSGIAAYRIIREL
ncbi:MAG: hypothetical protein JXX14_15890 [Deltaproteobacteria bacterium]|nr:hypothetical protein [Deltaproteobacteria bacterium]